MIYTTQGTCSKAIEFEIEDDKIKKVRFISGCPGSLQGIGKLVEGMDIDEAIKKLSGITCGGKNTSCPDQLAKALKGLRRK